MADLGHTLPVKATKKDIWELWVNVPKWPEWDTNLEEAKLDGEHAVGTTGSLKPHKKSAVTFKIVEIVEEAQIGRAHV